MSNTLDPTNVPSNTVDVFDSSGHLLAGGTFTGAQALQEAVSFADANGTNDIVSAGAGTYTGDLSVTAAMTIESAHGAGTVTTIGDGTNPANDAAIRVADGVSGVHIGADGHGLTIQMSATEQGSVYLAGNNSDTVIEGNNLVGVLGANPAENADLITGGGQHNLVVNDNTFSGNASFAAYVNGEANVNNPSWGSFTNNNITEQNATVVLDFGSNHEAVTQSMVNNDHFVGNNGFLALQDAGVIASHIDGAEVSTINAGYSLHGDVSLVTSVLDGGQELDQISNWNSGVAIDTADNWLGAPGSTGTAQQVDSNDVSISLSNGGEIDLTGNHVTVAQVMHDYYFV